MTANSLSEQIDRLSRRLAYRCHRYVHEGWATRNQIAKAAGLSWTLIKDIDKPTFCPTVKTLRALDHVIPDDWEPSVGLGEIIDQHVLNLGPYKIGVRQSHGNQSQSSKIYMDPAAVGAVEPEQIDRARRFLEQRRGRDGVIRANPLDLDVIKTLAPQCATHIFDIDDPNPANFKVIRWDPSTGFRGGIDYSGTNLSLFNDDDAFYNCVAEDFLTVRETRWSHFAALRRQSREQGTREFLRLLVPVRGSDMRDKMILIARHRAFTF